MRWEYFILFLIAFSCFVKTMVWMCQKRPFNHNLMDVSSHDRVNWQRRIKQSLVLPTPESESSFLSVSSNSISFNLYCSSVSDFYLSCLWVRRAGFWRLLFLVGATVFTFSFTKVALISFAFSAELTGFWSSFWLFSSIYLSFINV